MTRYSNPWHDAAEVERLKTLWIEGLSASQVALRLGNGRTRNAIIGKIDRIGMPKRINGGPRAPRPRRTKQRPWIPKQQPRMPPAEPGEAPMKEPKKPGAGKGIRTWVPAANVASQPLPVQSAPVSLGRSCTIVDLERDECRFPTSPHSIRSHRFCGAPTAAGLSWCPEHAALVFTALPPRKSNVGTWR